MCQPTDDDDYDAIPWDPEDDEDDDLYEGDDDEYDDESGDD